MRNEAANLHYSGSNQIYIQFYFDLISICIEIENFIADQPKLNETYLHNSNRTHKHNIRNEVIIFIPP